MDTEIRCQSCGMPLGEGFCGVEQNGSFSRDYCRFCYKFGQFSEPELTLEAMVQKSASHMVRVLGRTEAEARVWSEEIIPKLKRWQK